MSSQPDSSHRIVVGIDGSPASTKAVEWAARQAELTGAVLEVLVTWEWPTSYGWSLPVPTGYDPAHEAEQSLDKALEPIRKAHPPSPSNPPSSKAIPHRSW